ALVGPIAAKIKKMVRQMIAIAIRLTIVRMSLSQGSCTTGLSSSFIRFSPSSAAAGRRDRAQDDAHSYGASSVPRSGLRSCDSRHGFNPSFFGRRVTWSHRWCRTARALSWLVVAFSAGGDDDGRSPDSAGRD